MRLMWWTLVLVLVSGEDPPDVCSSMTVRLRSFRIVTSPCNFTTLRESQRRSVQSRSLVLVLPLIQILVLVLALPSNLLALWILLFRSERLPSTALLVNLTVCDLLLLLALPFRAVYHFSGNDCTDHTEASRAELYLEHLEHAAVPPASTRGRRYSTNGTNGNTVI